MVAINKRTTQKSLDTPAEIPITEQEYANRSPFRIVGMVMMALAAAMVVIGVGSALIDLVI